MANGEYGAFDGSEWHVGKTTASVQFVVQARLKVGKLNDIVAKLQDDIRKVKRGDLSFDEFVDINTYITQLEGEKHERERRLYPSTVGRWP